MPDFSLEKLAEPITKLIETIGTAVGIWYEPTRIKRKAKADAEAIKILARAKVEALAIQDSSLKDYYLGLEEEKLLLDFQKKHNRDSVLIMAVDQLEGKTVNEEKVDKDWVAQFISHVEKVSNEEMQLLWSKLLAGEVQKPGSFSKRAMTTLASMSTEEAKAFYEIAVYSFKNQSGEVVYPSRHTKFFPNWRKTNPSRNSVEILQTLNLLNDTVGKSRGILFKDEEDLGVIWISYFDYKIKITWEENDFKYLSINGLVFTHVGKELVQLVVPNQDMKDYLKAILTQTVFNYRATNHMPLRLTAEYEKLKDSNHNSRQFEKSEIISWRDATD